MRRLARPVAGPCHSAALAIMANPLRFHSRSLFKLVAP
jgi:hypothetical protein